MHPIIHPTTIYLMGVSNTIKMLCEKLLFIGVLLILILIISWVLINLCIEQDDKFYTQNMDKFLNRVIKYAAIWLIGVSITYIFAPSRNTIISMIITKEITYERVEKIAKQTGNLPECIKNDIILVIKEVLKKENND